MGFFFWTNIVYDGATQQDGCCAWWRSWFSIAQEVILERNWNFGNNIYKKRKVKKVCLYACKWQLKIDICIFSNTLVSPSNRETCGPIINVLDQFCVIIHSGDICNLSLMYLIDLPGFLLTCIRQINFVESRHLAIRKQPLLINIATISH